MAASSEGAGGVYNHLVNVLSDNEFSTLSNDVSEKLNKYIDEKFAEYLTSKALHETAKNQFDDKIFESDAKIKDLSEKLEDVKIKLVSKEDLNSNLQNKVDTLNSKFAILQDRNALLEKEVLSIKSVCDSAADERDDLARVLEMRKFEFERLSSVISDLSLKLQAAVDEKCEILTINNEYQKKELSLKLSEKRIEQERLLFNSQITALTDEINRLTNESQTATANNNSKLLILKTKLKETEEELATSKATINRLNETNKELDDKIENLTQRISDQIEVCDKLTANYKKELDLKSKKTELYKSSQMMTEGKVSELINGISELQNMLHFGTEKYGELETKFKQAQIDYDAKIKKYTETISSLKTELEHANDLLAPVNSTSFENRLNDMSPNIVKPGMTITQIYTQLVQTTNELSNEKLENKRLKITIDDIIKEFEDKAPSLAQNKIDLHEATETNIILTKQIDSLTIEVNKCRHEVEESSILVSNYKRKNAQLEGEIADLQNQICFLLRDMENKQSIVPHGDHDSSFDKNSSGTISKSLLQFSDIKELQSNNQKLIRIVKDLTEKIELLEKNIKELESGEYKQKWETVQKELCEVREINKRFTKTADEIIKQRDLYKKLYHDYTQKTQKNVRKDISKGEAEANESGGSEIKLVKVQQQLDNVRSQFETCKEEKIKSDKAFKEQVENLKKEVEKLTGENNKSLSTIEYYKQQFKVFQNNISSMKKEINELKEEVKQNNMTISKQEASLQYFRKTALTTDQTLSSDAQSLVEKYKAECQKLQHREVQLQSENESLLREQMNQETIKKYLESLKNNFDYVEGDSRITLLTRLKDANRECSAIRSRLEEEQCTFKKIETQLKEEISKNQLLIIEEKKLTEELKKEIIDLKQQLERFNSSEGAISQFLPFNSNEDICLISKHKELEKTIIKNDNEIKDLKEQLSVTKQHVKQYSYISENAELAVKTINDEYNNFKAETEQKITEYVEKIQMLENKCAELEAELSLQSNGDNVTTSNLKNDLEQALNELANISKKLESSEQKFNAKCGEMEKLSASLRCSEEKCTDLELRHDINNKKINEYEQEISQLHNQITELNILKNELSEKNILEISSWVEKHSKVTADYNDLQLRFQDLDTQNNLLLNQIQSLGLQLSLSQAGRSLTESFNESNCSTMNISTNEDPQLCSEQFLNILKFLRNEKDYAVNKCNELNNELINLKCKLEVTEKDLTNAKEQLNNESNIKSAENKALFKQSNIIKKIEALDALADSNRVLKSERDQLQSKVEELTSSVKKLQEEISPMNLQREKLSNTNEDLLSENQSLKCELTRWKTRVKALIERTNKTNTEDWKRLQNEKEHLAKQLNSEKELNKKNSSELATTKAEKNKLEDQNITLTRQHQSLTEDNKKLNCEVQNVSEESKILKAELETMTVNNKELTTEVSNKDKLLADITNKELQMRKIAKKYKNQYEELLKSIEEDKNNAEGKVDESQLTELQNELEIERANVEKLQSDLKCSIDKEAKAKQLLKVAKTKIFQLTETKNELSRELEESQRNDNSDRSGREEKDERLALIKSQFEAKIVNLERENAETQTKKEKVIEGLQQKINLLQRQISNQTTISKQTNADKVSSEPPTANIKPMAACPAALATTSTSSGAAHGPSAGAGPSPGTAFSRAGPVRPVAQVGPTASAPAPAPHEADGEAGPGVAPPAQQVALVLPRMEPHASSDVSTSRPHKRLRDLTQPINPRAPLGKRARPAHADTVEEPEPEPEAREVEADAEAEARPEDSPEDSPETATEPVRVPLTLAVPGAVSVVGAVGAVGAVSVVGEAVAEFGDDGIVPSTPTLYVPRRADGFGEAVVSPAPPHPPGEGAPPHSPGEGVPPRFTFAHHDTHPELPPPGEPDHEWDTDTTAAD